MNKLQKRIIEMFVICMAFLFLNGITVNADSADNSLRSLTLSEGTLSPAFQYNVVSYTASVGNGTTSVDVNAKLSDAAATIQSITGNTDLKEGSNTIKIVVAAENGNLATYTINLTRTASETAGAGTNQNENDLTNDPNANQTSPENNNTGGDNQEPDTTEEDITINTGSYTISATIPEEVIPEDFTMTEVTYQDEACEALQFDKGSIILIYMTDEEGSGALFVWNQTDGSVYPFIRLAAGEKYIIIQQRSAENVPGEEFLAADLSIDGKSVPSVYQNNMEGTEDFYLIYAIDNDGVGGDYWYDKIGGTYQRYVEMMSQEESSNGVEYEFLQKEFTELSNKYTNIKSKDAKIITGMIIALAICVILIINLFISRGKKSRFEDEIELEDEIITEKPKPAKKTKKEEEPEFFDENIWKPKKEKPKKKKKREDIFDDDDFMDEDTFLDDGFEETPGGKKASIQDDKASIQDTKASILDTKASILDTKASILDTKASILDTLEILDLNDL